MYIVKRKLKQFLPMSTNNNHLSPQIIEHKNTMIKTYISNI